MRFMVMVKATKDSEAGVMPGEQLLAEMGKYNEELAKAGIMTAGEGLQPSSQKAGQVLGRKADRDRWPVRGDERARRRLLDVAMQVVGRGDRVGQAPPQSHAE